MTITPIGPTPQPAHTAPPNPPAVPVPAGPPDTGVEQLPSAGDAVIHPGLDGALLRHLLQLDRPLWTPRQLRELTRTVAAELTVPLLDVLRYDETRRWWRRLALTGGVELWLLSWTPGQHTAPHDHGGAAGAFSVLTGTLHEEYRYAEGPIRLAEYHVGAGIGFGGGRAHQVRNQYEGNAASVHAYSPPLLPTREYRSLDAVPATPVAPAWPGAGAPPRGTLGA